MKSFKISSVLLLSIFSMWAFMPQLSAGHHGHCGRGSWGLNLNFGGPVYEPAPAPVVVQPIPVAPAPAYVNYGYPYAPAPAYTYYQPYPQQVIVQRPVAAPGFYVGPQFSYRSSWHHRR